MASLGESPSFRTLAKISPKFSCFKLNESVVTRHDPIPAEIGYYAESRMYTIM